MRKPGEFYIRSTAGYSGAITQDEDEESTPLAEESTKYPTMTAFAAWGWALFCCISWIPVSLIFQDALVPLSLFQPSQSNTHTAFLY